MEVENTQKSILESKLFKIPIEEYEKDMETKLARERRKEILDTFTNYNQLNSDEEFNEVRYKLQYACRDGDIELIKIYLCKPIVNESNDIIFKIDKINKTASLFKVKAKNEELFIPRTVKYESTDYLITSICEINNSIIKTIKFVENSAVKTIYNLAHIYDSSKIEEIYFPESLKELKEGWCSFTDKLTKIVISPSNGQFIYKDDKYLVGKSDETKDEFDVLLFARRDIEEISIPSNIKIISSNAFYKCKNLKKVEIPSNSNLHTIESDAFYSTKIEEIYFPTSLKELKKGWCNGTYRLTRFVISPSNNNFIFKDNKYLIGKSDESGNEYDILLFGSSDIEEISVPSDIKIISSYAFSNCEKPKKVEIPTNSNLQIIESCAFLNTNIEEIFIPQKVLKICKNAFCNCKNLKKVEIPANSDLQTIESKAFYSTIIEEISIPSKVSKIGESAFDFCRSLIKVKIPKNSSLQTIESNAFSRSNIEEIYFPESLKELEKGWCSFTDKLTKIVVSPSNGQFIFKDDKYLVGKSDETKDEFDVLLFARRDIEEISIPSNIKIISSYAFSNCENLKKVEIPSNSNLHTIESDAFYSTKIEEIFIPSKVSKIHERAFCSCQNLKKVEVPANSELQLIDYFAFSKIQIEEFSIPSKVTKISEHAFFECKKLRKVDIPVNSDLQVIEKGAFSETIIEEFSIPSKISKISESLFEQCENLRKVEIPKNFNLQTIEKNAFSYSRIREIFIPSKITKICEYAFYDCKNLKKVEIPTNSDLKIIEAYAFSNTIIEEISIPSKVTKICEYVFSNCKNLKKVEIPMNSDLQTIELHAFSNTNIEEIFIPSKVTNICENSFFNCTNLRKVEIPTNSDLKIIEKNAFSYSMIEEISIPSKVTKICEYAFSNNINLRKVEIPKNSDLQTIESHAFSNTSIEEIFIPSKVTKLCEYAFNCENLTKIEISENSDLREIENHAFSETKIKYIYIPSKIQYYFRYKFYDYHNLIQIQTPKNSQKTNKFVKTELSILPHTDIPFDCSSILSVSLAAHNIVIITKDYKAFVYNKSQKEEFQEYPIKNGNNGNVCYPISGYCSDAYSLYLVSYFVKGIKTTLVKNGNFLNIGNLYPVAIFCGNSNCAAIDLKGAILYIPSSYNEHSTKSILPYYLPNKEKAVEIACLSDFLYVLNSKGTLYMSKNAHSFKIVLKQVEQFKRIKIIQISGYYEHILVLTENGKVYSKGKNHYGELGTGDKEDRLNKFFEISSLNKYKIVSVSAGKCHSLFLTSEGKVLACGSNEFKQCFYESISNDYSTVLPVECPFQRGVEFCISSNRSSAFCVGFDPEMSPNRRVKDEINILLLGCKEKTQILQAFINNKFDNSLNSDNQDEEEYIVDLEIHKKVIRLKLIDAENTNNYVRNEKYHNSAMNIMYFFDNSNQYSVSFDILDRTYKEINEVWNDDLTFVFVNYIDPNSSSKKLNYNEIAHKYKCKIFEVGVDKNIKYINEPFFSFLPNINEYKNDILKIGKEYRNPFNNINKNHINIGLFGSKNVNKTELGFRYTYDDLYKDFYENYINNFADTKLEKIVEIKSNYFNVSVLDSTFVNDNDDDFSSYYSAVQGIVFVFQIDLLSSSSDFINEINQFHQKAKNSVKSELNFTIALKVEESDKINDLYQSLFDKINQIEESFDCKVFLFSIENGENVEDLFYFLIKKIIRNRKKEKVSKPKKKHNKKKKTKTSYLLNKYYKHK